MIRSTLIILFGAIPASVLCWFAALAIFIGGPGFVATGDASFLLVLIWGVAGVGGTIALWIAAIGPMTAPVYLGLIAGLLAVSPISVGVSIELKSLAEVIFQYSAVSTFIVALLLLVEFGRRVYFLSKLRTDSD